MSTEIKGRIRVMFTAAENVNLYQVIQGFILHTGLCFYLLIWTVPAAALLTL